MDYTLAPHIKAFSTERQCADADNPYDGFNITPYVADEPTHILKCREALCQQLHISDNQLILPHQTHGTRIVEINRTNLAASLEDTDGVITALPNVCIGVSTADCVPLLMHDTQTGAIAAIHAGWRGTVANISVLALGAMHDAFGTLLKDVQCIIGPSIGPQAFEVGDEVYEAFSEAGFPMEHISRRMEKKWHINLWQANAHQLISAGLQPNAIQTAAICTYTHYDRFFSARRLGIRSGRIFNGIMRVEHP